MNEFQIHLLINHLPIFSTLFSLLILGAGFLLKNKTVKYVGLAMIILTALVIVPVNASGEAAEDPAEKIAGIQHSAIHDHEEASKPFLIFSLVLGAMSVIAIVLERKKINWSGILYPLLLLGLAVNLYFAYRAGHSGGLIRHPEISTELKFTPENNNHDAGENGE